MFACGSSVSRNLLRQFGPPLSDTGRFVVDRNLAAY
jgi:hypothetical protein